jgi:hypothetical protein
MVDLLKCEDFEPHLHSRFEMTVGEAATSLELIAVERLPQQPRVRQPFSLLFKHAGTTVCPQGIYRLSHAKQDEFEIFLVPIGRDESGVRYEAIFN